MARQILNSNRITAPTKNHKREHQIVVCFDFSRYKLDFKTDVTEQDTLLNLKLTASLYTL